jgi:hypothetical protein
VRTRSVILALVLIVLMGSFAPKSFADGSAYSSTVSVDGPTSYWMLNQASAPVSDSTSGFTASIVGGVTLGAAGPAADSTSASFDGTSGYLNVPYQASLNPTTNYTVEAWIKPAAASSANNNNIVASSSGAGVGYIFSLDTANHLAFCQGLGASTFACTTASSYVVSPNAWHHVGASVATTSPGNYQMIIYLDGSAVSTYAFAGTPVANTSAPLRIGANSAGAKFFAGNIAHVAVYPSTFSAGIFSTHNSTMRTGGTPPVNTVAPTASGVATPGSTLTATQGSWSGAGNTYVYQWQGSTDGTSWGDFPGATSSTYSLTTANNGYFMRIKVTATNAGGVVSAVSAATAKVAVVAPSNTVTPVVSGSTTVGSSLTTTLGTWTGTAPITYTYQWQSTSNGGTTWSNISGATFASYTVIAGDVGKQFRANIIATNSAGTTTGSSTMTGAASASPPTAPVNTVSPTLSGSAQDGAVISVSNGTWTGSATITYAYQWQSSPDGTTWSNVASATSSSYTSTSGDVGKLLRAQVTGTNGAGSSTAITSASTAVTAAAATTPPTNTSPPTVSGTATVGQTLTGGNGTWSGSATITFAYQWQTSTDGGATWTNISGATASTYTIVAGDSGNALRLGVTGTNAYGNATAYSASTGAVGAAGTPPTNTAIPTISGTAQVGQSLTAASGSWSGSPAITYAYQWQSSPDGSTWTNISGATGSVYNIVAGDNSNYIRVSVTGTNGFGNATAFSGASAQVTNPASTPPSNTSLPTISGTAQQGQTLTGGNGSWSGSPTITYSLQWQVSPDGSTWANISGATSATYLLSASEVGKFVRFGVTGTNTFGNSTAYSTSTSAITASGVAPSNSSLPTLSGTPQDGQTLVGASGSWAGSAPISYSYQWQTSPDATTWSDLAGATSTGYALTSGDVGNYIRVKVSATNAYGSASAFSSATSAITAATSAPVNTSLPLLSGTPQDGQTLTGSNGVWSGSATITYSYQWQSSPDGSTWAAISGATSSTYTATSSDVSKYLRIGVTATNGVGSSLAYSAASAPVAGQAPINNSLPTFSGSASDGSILNALSGSWSGSNTITYSYQWQSSPDAATWTNVSGATTSSYTIPSSSVGKYLRVQVLATNSYGSASAVSVSSAAITSALPSSSSAPTISGSAIDGQTLTGSSGSWSGSPVITYSYQWQSGATSGGPWSNISGATGTTYALTSTDISSFIRLAVVATNGAGSATAYSASTSAVAGATPVSTGLPSISGTAQDGQTLTGANGTWTGSPAISYSYQWQSGTTSGGPWSNIVGASSGTYTVGISDLGNYIRLSVTGTNGYGSSVAYSSSTAQVGATSPSNTSIPLVSGTAQDGSTLTTSNGVWSGTPTLSYAYQWQTSADGITFSPISGATSSVYVIPSSQIGRYIRSSVIASNGAGNATAFSTSTSVVAGTPPSNNSAPLVSGAANDGQTISGSIGSWSGTATISYAYQWQSSPDGITWSDIASATTSTYTIASTDISKYLRLKITATNTYGAVSAFSSPTSAVTGNAPSNTSIPALSGIATDGSTLSGTNGTWAGSAPITYTYQWQSGALATGPFANISGATGATYTIAPTDVGNYLRLMLTATNSYGSASAASASSAQVSGNAPTNTVLPSFSGTAQDGQALAGSAGSWSGSPTISYAYQWQTSPDGATWTSISGATSSTYTIQPSDVATYLRLRVTATNSSGSALAYSGASALVAGNSPLSSSPPAVSGSVTDGGTVTGTNGAWSGTPSISYTYQWQDSSASSGPFSNIVGATSSTYSIPSTEIGNYLRLSVTGTNSYGSSSALSSVTAQITGNAPSNTSIPSVSGSATDGSTLSGTTGSWSGSPTITYSYQWQSSPDGSTSWANLSGATTATYTVNSGDVGNYLRIKVVANNSFGSATSFSSTSSQIAAATPANTTLPSISGTTTDGQILSATNGSWTGSPTITYTYQWQTSPNGTSSWTNLSGATSATYTLTSSDVSNYVRVVVTATNGSGAVSATSATSAQISGATPSISSLPLLSGTAADGQTLSGTNGSWNGTPAISYAYQWQDASASTGPWTNISGATGASYTIASAEVGKYLRVSVSATNAYGSATASSAASSLVSGNAPTNTSIPGLSGTTQQGQVLTGSNGSWSGSPTITYAYQWESSPNGTSLWASIPAATSSTYTLTSSDVSNYVRLKVVATNAFGSATAFSSSSTQISGVAPTNITLPLLSGTATDGSLLSATSGSWSGTPTITYTYQWQTSPNGTSSWANISGATSSTYSLVSADVGNYIRVSVTATNGSGSATALSASSSQIAGDAPSNTALPTISGTAADGQALSAATGSWNGTPAISYTYQWQSSPDSSTWANIAGATGSSYTIASSQVGNYLRIQITATNSYGSASAASASTAPVSGNAPTNTSAPALSGSFADGQAVNGTNGSWSGSPTITFTYQWQSSPDAITWADVASATSASYTIASAQIGNYLRLKVTATNGSGVANAFSAASTQVVGNAPSNTSLPTLSGVFADSQNVSSSTGSWTGSPTITYAYQWQSGTSATGPWANLSGATAATYTITSTDIGNYLRVRVTATNGSGSATVSTAASTQVTGSAPVNTTLPLLSGATSDGSVMSATNGSWTGSPTITYTYQWQSGTSATGPWTNLSGATSATYTLQPTDIGNYLRVSVTATNGSGSASAASASSAQVSGNAPTNTSLPTISGVASDGQVLTGATGSWSGSPTITYAYQWQSSPDSTTWSNIAGATASTYTIPSSDIGKFIRIKVVGTNGFGSTNAFSSATSVVSGASPSNASIPTISGAAADGQVLTGTNGSWTGSPTITYSYQWQTSPDGSTWAAISGATSISYTATSTDIGKFLRIAVIATNGAGSATAYSIATSAVAGNAPANSVAPTLSGTAQDGQVLSASNGSWTGSPTITYTYQWQTSSSSTGPWGAISGATASTYTLTSADIGNYVRILVTATNPYGSASLASAASAQVTGNAPVNSSLPLLSGTAQDTQTLSASSGTWTGSPTITYSYQWQSSPDASTWSAVAGATSATYSVVSGDVGKYLRVRVIATNGTGSATAFSTATAVVVGSAPVNSTNPSISGSATDGQVLSASSGTWSGTPTITYTYQWQDGSASTGPFADIVGATSSTYTIPSAEIGKYIRLNVTAANGSGSTTAASSATAAVGGNAPTNSVAPALSGTAQDAQTLSAANGTWSGSPTITFVYQWQTSSASTGPFTDIAGATASTYAIPSAQVGNYLRVMVIATNAYGSASLPSASSAQVTGNAPSNTTLPVISGSAADAQTLSSSTGSWSGTPTITYTYQWQSSPDASTWSDIAGSTASTYTVVSGDIGKYIRVRVTATNTSGSASAFSSATSVVVGAIPANTTPPNVSGVAGDGQTLTGTTGSWSGSPTITYAYQWQDAPAAAGPYTNIAGAISGNYTISSADIGKYLRLSVIATNGSGSTTAFSSNTASVTGNAPANTTLPTLSGTATDGATLSSTNGSWSGSPTITYSYQWQSGTSAAGPWANIAGATSATYTITSSDIGKWLRIVTTGTNPYGSAFASSAASAQVAGAAPANTALPVVSGSASDGSTLSSSTGSWIGSPVITYTYQWQSSPDATTWTNIAGATASTYTVISADVGKYIRSRVSATNAYGVTNAFSSATPLVAGSAPVNTVLPAVSGSANDGQTLTATTGTWSGTPVITYAYQWQSSPDATTWSNIAAATASTYSIPSTDIGKFLRVRITATNAAGSAAANSSATAAVTGNAPANTILPTISGTTTDGQTLSTTTGSWSGSPTITYSYQWQSGTSAAGPWSNVAGATSSTYTLTSAEIGKWMRVQVKGTNPYGFSTVSSASSSQVAGAAPANSSLPTLSGSATDGATLTGANGSWSGSPAITYIYQWQSSPDATTWSAIAGATASTYTIPSSYVGKYLRLQVTGTNAYGASSASSAPTALVSGVAPTNTTVPTVSGTATDGQTLSSTTGAWSGTPTITFAYQWQSGTSAAGPWSNIAGATSATYTLTPTEVGKWIRLGITGTNGSGSNSAFSASTAQVGGIAPSNTVAPSISGSATDGSTLTASNGSWSGTPTITFAYQWQSGTSAAGPWSNIAAASASTYTAVSGDIGKWIRVQVTGTSPYGSSSVFSASVGSVAGNAPSNSSIPTLSGSTIDGSTLTAGSGTWAGSPTITYAYQWQSSSASTGPWANLAGATSSTYTLTSANVGNYLRIQVTATNPYGSTPAVSTSSAQITGAVPVNTSSPTQSGTAQDGQTLTAATGSWSGTPTITYSYQWQSSGTSTGPWANIAGATSSNYTIPSAQIGNYLRVFVTATNGSGSATAASAASAIVAGSSPINAALPTTGGTTTDGQTLTSTPGTWNGSPTITYTYQWQDAPAAAGPYTNIAGATSATYTVSSTEIGKYLHLQVTATNPYGSASAVSAAVGPVAAILPVNTAAPQITGFAKATGTLTATSGTWTGSPTITYTYQWQSCNPAGAACANIAGATGASYSAVVGDVGKTLRVQVSATNAAGTAAPASSATSDMVVAGAIGFGANLGTANSKTASATLVVTLTAAATVGQTIIINLTSDTATGMTMSATDSKGNVYGNMDGRIDNGTNVNSAVISGLVTTALAAGDTITITWAGGTPTVRAASVSSFNGVSSSSTGLLDGPQSGVGSSTAPTTAALTTTQANELLIGAIGSEGSIADIFTAGAGWTALTRSGTTGGAATSNDTVDPEYRIVAAVGTYNATATITSRRWADVIIGYKASFSKTW